MSYMESEVVALPSQEEVVLKQEKDDSLETWENPQGLSYQIECKTEVTHEITIKEELPEPNVDKDLSSLDSQHANHASSQSDGTLLTSQDCEKINIIDISQYTGIIITCGYCRIHVYNGKSYEEHVKRCGKGHYPLDEIFQENPIEYEKKKIYEKSFVCHICNKTYNKSYRSTHFRTHTGEKPYSCDLCNQKFITKANLTVHRRTHTGERPFTCNLCYREFVQQSALDKHKKMHTGENAISCELCNIKKCGLFRHRRILKKQFACNLCHKEFVQKRSLIIHRRTHNSKKP